MKNLKFLVAVSALMLLIFGAASSADAQRRKPGGKRAAAAKPAANSSEIKASAEKVSTQLKNLTKFIYLLGGIARNIEDNDKNSRGRKISQNEENKQKVIGAIRNFRAGLAALETEFRVKPALKLYNFQIQGISDLTGQAEDLAVSGNFTESGKVLLSVVEKLSDTLVSLP